MPESPSSPENVAGGNSSRPLEGVRVVEMGQLLAGPFCGTLLAYYGAEVIKIEPRGGDPIRTWRETRDGVSFWWYSVGRNKKSVTLDLKSDEGRDLARRLIDTADVLIENFRPGTLEKWGLTPESLRKDNPGLIVSRISGYGQSGPLASHPGYASVCEGFGGLRYINGFPGERPVRPNLSLGDSLSGLHAAFGVLLALVERGKSRLGQDVDVAIFESVYNMMEAVVPEYDGAGVVREPSGSTITGIVPTNTYLCKDDKYVIIGGNGESIYQRLMRAAGRPDMADDPKFVGNENRVKHEQEIDDALTEWTRSLTMDEVLDALRDAQVPSGPIYSVREMMADPQYQARELFEEVEAGGSPLKLPAIVPKLSRTPGETEWAGPALGEHNDAVLESIGVSAEEIEQLRRDEVI